MVVNTIIFHNGMLMQAIPKTQKSKKIRLWSQSDDSHNFQILNEKLDKALQKVASTE